MDDDIVGLQVVVDVLTGHAGQPRRSIPNKPLQRRVDGFAQLRRHRVEAVAEPERVPDAPLQHRRRRVRGEVPHRPRLQARAESPLPVATLSVSAPW